MKLIVGLGNDGEKYDGTFHNMGFMAIDALASRLGARFDKRECESSVATIYRGGEKVVLAKPLTFMNLSGVAVKQLTRKYGVKPSELLVIYDDLDIPACAIRMRLSGSAGTHNGMRNIIAELGCENFPRLRIGIGGKPSEVPLVNYVLSRVPSSLKDGYAAAFEKAADLAVEFLDGKARACSA